MRTKAYYRKKHIMEFVFLIAIIMGLFLWIGWYNSTHIGGIRGIFAGKTALPIDKTKTNKISKQSPKEKGPFKEVNQSVEQSNNKMDSLYGLSYSPSFIDCSQTGIDVQVKGYYYWHGNPAIIQNITMTITDENNNILKTYPMQMLDNNYQPIEKFMDYSLGVFEKWKALGPSWTKNEMPNDFKIHFITTFGNQPPGFSNFYIQLTTKKNVTYFVKGTFIVNQGTCN